MYTTMTIHSIYFNPLYLKLFYPYLFILFKFENNLYFMKYYKPKYRLNVKKNILYRKCDLSL